MSVIGKLKEEACLLKCGNTVEVDFAIEDENGGDATDPGEVQADAQDLADAIAAQAFASSVFDGGASCHKPKIKSWQSKHLRKQNYGKTFSRCLSLYCTKWLRPLDAVFALLPIARCGFCLSMLSI